MLVNPEWERETRMSLSSQRRASAIGKFLVLKLRLTGPNLKAFEIAHKHQNLTKIQFRYISVFLNLRLVYHKSGNLGKYHEAERNEVVNTCNVRAWILHFPLFYSPYLFWGLRLFSCLFSSLKSCTLNSRKVAIHILSLVLVLPQQIWSFLCQAIKLRLHRFHHISSVLIIWLKTKVKLA